MNATDAISAELAADSAAVIEQLTSAKPLDPKTYRRIRARAQQITAEIRQKHGTLDIGVPAVVYLMREMQNLLNIVQEFAMPATTISDVILGILQKADGEWIGKTRFYKAVYFAHLYYAIDNPTFLSECKFARMSHGPGIHNGSEIFASLVNKGELAIEQIHEGPYPEYRYRLTRSEGNGNLPAEAALAIERAVLFCRDKTATQLSQITHEWSRSWNMAENDGQVINIYLDLIPEEEHIRINLEIDQAEKLLETVLKDSANEKRSPTSAGHSS